MSSKAHNTVLYHATIASAILAMVATVSLAISVHPNRDKLLNIYSEPPKVVEQLITEMADPDYTTEKGLTLFSEYFNIKQPSTTVEVDAMSIEQDAFESVFRRYGSALSDVVIIDSNSNATFTTFYLKDAEGEQLSPLIGFWYDTDGDNVDTWMLGYLEPFSVYDEYMVEDMPDA